MNDVCVARYIPRDVERELWSRSGGHCANPACRADLFPLVDPESVVSTIELAHIVGYSDCGPRSQPAIPTEVRNDYANIVLLCPTCHTLVDDEALSHVFPEDVVRDWKVRREREIAEGVGTPTLENRGDLDRHVARLLRANHAVWETYGPEGRYSADPISDAARTWRREVLRVILPNNRRIVELCRRNDHLLDAPENDVLAAFEIHVDAFAFNHVSGDVDPSAPRFPPQMADVFAS